MNRISIREWIQCFQEGQFDKPDRATQIRAGWYDWFCKDSALRNKTYKMGNIIVRNGGKGKIDLDRNYVFFKNNCPLNGPLYDDFRFCDMETGNVQFTVQIACCWTPSRYAVYGRTPDGVFHSDEPIFQTNSVKELALWFNTPWPSVEIDFAELLKK